MQEVNKIVLEKEQSKLIFEEKNSNLEIDFFSLLDTPTFEIAIEDECIYNSFKKFVSRMNEESKNLFGEQILETIIYSEDESAGISILNISITNNSVILNFSSPFHTNIILSKENDKYETKLMCELFDDLRNINMSYQTYFDEYFSSGKELRLELK